MYLGISPYSQSFTSLKSASNVKKTVGAIKETGKSVVKPENSTDCKKGFLGKYFEYLVEGLEAMKSAITPKNY